MVESDEVLIARAQGDPVAFGEIYERYLSKIYDYVYRRVGSAVEAEDLTGAVFLQALSHLPRYVDRGAPITAWLYRIAHNLVANWYRDHSREPVLPLDDAVPSDDRIADIVQTEETDLLRRVVASLSPERQRLLLLKYVEQMSNAEIGQALGRTEGAVKALLHRTLEGLREALVRHGLA